MTIRSVRCTGSVADKRNVGADGLISRLAVTVSPPHTRAAARLTGHSVAAGMLLLLLLLCCPVQAARLQTMAWTGTNEVVAHPPSLTYAAPDFAGNLHLLAVLPDAEIMPSAGYLVKAGAYPINGSEFSSLEILADAPAATRTAHQYRAPSEVNPSEEATGAVAAMPLMALAWLFGIGVIGIGTVGRRRKQP